ncbi:AfsR/SARP family transcriptional regulator [Streptomyces sp. H10-C2]|uniref:AfsR/SARP family transcriptional regulator n=1 Tax=unclassified Streptomyces TaxID=2593676 RepID=UPI0024BA6CB0|nr:MULTISPECIES: AfsR/SARP family transcriptional regulator [unclassified Streptomyces]MDJ0346720.1 AfsR/SARP family transcriptional regulator [Streptomyces sp. PH10-H1]MDJ0375162.1 AfsR/SARP family transcriptional regulator [Streptomyces sp. H10-C2]
MRFNLLGPLEAFEGDAEVPLGGVNQRSALGFLLLHANTVVPTSKLVNALWGYDVPVTSRKMIQNAISGLRKLIAEYAGPEGTASLVTCAPGYRLRIDEDCLDLIRFRRLEQQGRAELAAGDQESAVRSLRAALAVWRGPVLADLAETGIAWPELDVVRNARLAVFEDCVRIELDLGRHHELLGELEAMAAAEPTRERLCGLLMLALYQCSRQYDALAAYQRTRAALLNRFGLDPGRELQQLERSILNQDRTLAPATRPEPQWTRRIPAPTGRCTGTRTVTHAGRRVRPPHRYGRP